MKFTYKLFFSITALLTAAFMLFGSFMLFSYFNRMLERETEQGKRENLLFQTIYDMVYQNMDTGRKFRNRTDDGSERYGMYDT
jgi:hypothetical protein